MVDRLDGEFKKTKLFGAMYFFLLERLLLPLLSFLALIDIIKLVE